MKSVCPVCSHHWSWLLNDGRRKCRRCGHKYCCRSVWEWCKLSEKTKQQLLDYFVLGVPGYRLRFKQSASLPTIERFFRMIRATLSIEEGCREPFTGPVECDESSFGGHSKGKRGWGAANKIIVLGILQRNGIVRVFPIKGREASRIIPLIRQATTPGALYYTDNYQAYASLAVRGNHIVINKEKGRPKGRDHINGIEGFWSYAKHWLYHYRGVPKKFFHFYLGETSYRFNYRESDLYPLIHKLLRQTEHSKIARFLVRNP
jgi:transposase